MKTLLNTIMIAAMVMVTFTASWAQDSPMFLTVVQSHWNWDNTDGSPDRWLELEKSWHDNVIMKNEHILGSGVYNHLYTGDNSEVLFVTLYPSWESIMKAGPRNAELAAEAWPDEDERMAGGKERNSYYHAKHSDEIYVVRPAWSKPIAEFPDEELVFLVVDRHRAFPEDAEDGEFADLMQEFVTNVTHKNPHLVGHYVYRHAWGSDGRDIMEVFVVKSLDDVDDMQDAQGDLIEAHWTDEEKRKEFFEAFNKYFTPWHSDRFYQNVPELMKNSVPEAKE